MKNSRPSNITILHEDQLDGIPWLLHGFSTRLGGFSELRGEAALNLGFTQHDSRAAVERNRAAFLDELGAVENGKPWPLVTLRQVHSDLIHCVSKPPKKQLVGDGLISRTPGLLLAVQTADCLPVMLVDPKSRAIGVFHAGWRGTLKRIVEKGVGEMHRRFETRPSDLKATIGPGIHGCCYEVGSEVQQKFESQFAYAADLFRVSRDSEPIRDKYPLLFLSARPPGHSELPKKTFLDLVQANRCQLLDAGVRAENVSASLLCTSCRTDRLFSHRKEKGATGRMMGVAGIRKL